MVAEAEIEDGADAAAKRKPSKKLLIIGAAVVLVVAAGGASFFLFFSAPKDLASEMRLAEVPETFIFNLPSMTVNLNSDGEGEQFMKLTVALEVANEEMMIEIQPRMAKVVDAFQVYLRELRRSDLEGSAGIYRLKEELRRRVNVAIFPAQVESILFKEILVQ
ncbi:MAG: flagellar basal body-associated FliL family protein [Devosia sp.]